jgi:hypothetical protein
MSMIELGAAPEAMRIVESVNPHASWVVQREAVLDPVRAGARGLDQLRRNPYPITLRELKLEAVEAEQYLQLIFFGHFASYQAFEV